ncbi:MAG: hypothetical protein HY782_03030 [Chloroflexi bacterium]|nr:hypothetical protein [Chloroflexota bacterium]
MTGKVALLGLAFLTLFIFGNFYFTLTGGPSRTQTARLDPYGEISIHLETEPDPPKTGGIPLMLHITDPSGKSIAVDEVQYEYAFQDREPRTLKGESKGVGAFTAVAALNDVGEWQVRVTLVKGTQQTQVKFTLRVGANI